MDSGRCLSRLWGLFRSRPPSLAATNCHFTRPELETLEDRSVPSGLSFAARYGPEATTIGKDVLTGDVPVFLIFAGGQGAVYGQDGTVSQSQIITAVNNILNSSFLSGLSEYGAATHAHLAGTAVSNCNLPRQFTDDGNGSDVNKLVSATLADAGGSLPTPDHTTPQGIYFVITPQGYTLKGEVGSLGHHSSGFAGSPPDLVNVYDAVVLSEVQYVPSSTPTVNQPGKTVHFSPQSSLDTMTETISHELIEVLTDPDGNGNGGVDAAPSSSFATNFPNQAERPGEICDNEAELYVAYENGTAVQPYWSQQGADYIAPGATLPVSAAIAPTVAPQAGTTSNAGSPLSTADGPVSHSADVGHDPGTGPASTIVHLDSTLPARTTLLEDLPSSAPEAITATPPAEHHTSTTSSTAAVELGMSFIDSSWMGLSWLRGWRITCDWSP
jgi:hypothetical protein